MLFICALIALTFGQQVEEDEITCNYDLNIVQVSNSADLEDAIQNIASHSTIILADGRYETADLQINDIDCVLFRSAEDSTVILDASIELSGNIVGEWSNEGNLWSVTLADDVTVWQLFTSEFKEVSLGRYPNVQGEDIWNANLAFRQQVDDESFNGVLVDELKPCEDSESSTILANQPSFDGCMAVLNIGHWETIEAQVTHNGDTLLYENEEVTYKNNLGRYFIECLAAVDSPNEWGLDWEEHKLYVRLPEGVSTPDGFRGKRADFIFSISNSNYILFQNLNFFAGGVRMTEVKHSEVSDCTFSYSSYNKRALQQSHGAPGALVFLGQGLNQGGEDQWTYNTVQNCEFTNTDGAALVMQMQRSNTVSDNLFSHIDYSAAYAHGAIDFQSSDLTVFTHNTVTTTGSSETIRVGHASDVSLNYFTNGGLLQEDGAAVQVRTQNQENTVIEKNWAINNAKKGFRFDTSNNPTAADGSYSSGSDGTMRNNVAFNNRGGFTVKGNNHIIWRNTAVMNNWFTRGNNGVEAGVADMAIWTENSMFDNQPYNMDTATRRNFVQMLSGSSSGGFTDLPGQTGGNYNGFFEDEHVFNRLRDPMHGDFRPVGCPNSPATCSAANDWGAYSGTNLKRTQMWVPGRRLHVSASFPLPYEGSDEVPTSIDLKWQTTQDSRCKYDVYMTHEEPPTSGLDAWLASTSWKSLSANLQGNRKNLVENRKIVDELGDDWVQGRTYYWRVETVRGNGARCSDDLNGAIPGEAAVWSFTTGAEFEFQPRGDCAEMFNVEESDIQQTLREFAAITDDDMDSYCANSEVEELWAESEFFGTHGYFEYDCDTWQCGLERIYQPTCDLEAVALSATQLGNKVKVARRASAVGSNVCDYASQCDAESHEPNGAELPTIDSQYSPSTCVIGLLESEMEEFSDLLQQTIRVVFGSLSQKQMIKPDWSEEAGGSCREGSTFLCAQYYCDAGDHERLALLRDTFTSDSMAMLRHGEGSVCSTEQVETAALHIGGKASFVTHFEHVHACLSDDQWNTGATRRLLSMAQA